MCDIMIPDPVPARDIGPHPLVAREWSANHAIPPPPVHNETVAQQLVGIGPPGVVPVQGPPRAKRSGGENGPQRFKNLRSLGRCLSCSSYYERAAGHPSHIRGSSGVFEVSKDATRLGGKQLLAHGPRTLKHPHKLQKPSTPPPPPPAQDSKPSSHTQPRHRTPGSCGSPDGSCPEAAGSRKRRAMMVTQ